MGSELKRNNSFEQNIGEPRLRLPFSLKQDSINVSRTAASRIPLLALGKQHENKGPLTKSHILIENNIPTNTPAKRPSPFFLSSSQRDSSRRRVDSQVKGDPFLSLNPDSVKKTEEKLFALNHGREIPRADAHIPTHRSSSPPVVDEQATVSSKLMTYSQFIPTSPGLYRKRTNSQEKTRVPTQEFFNGSFLGLSASPRTLDSLDIRAVTPEEDIKPHASSRARSALTIPYTGEQDISTLLMLGAAEARNCKADLAEQRREGVKLMLQLEAANKAKSDLEHRLEVAKAATRKLLDTSNAKYEELDSMFRALRDESQRSFAFAEEARSSMSSLKQTQERALDSVKVIEPFLKDSGTYSKVAETKAIIHELRAENIRCQQVIDLLRDKLHTVCAELVEAKNRVSELETNQIMEGIGLKHSTACLSSSVLKIDALMKQLEKRESESFDALQYAATTESKLLTANERIEQLTQTLGEKDVALEQMRHLQEEHTILKLRLEERAAMFANLETVQNATSDKLERAVESIREHEMKVGVLQEQTRLQEELIAGLKQLYLSGFLIALRDFDFILIGYEKRRRRARRIDRPSKNYKTSSGVALPQNFQRFPRTNNIRRSLHPIVNFLHVTALMRTTQLYRAQQASRRFEVLQERFEDQSMTLRITKELNGDLQERLVSTEAAHAAKLESNTGRLKLETAVLHEQKANLEDQLERLKNEAAEDARLHAQNLASVSQEFQNKLAMQESSSNRILQTEENRATRAEGELHEVKKELSSVKRDSEKSKNTIVILNEKLAHVQGELEAARERVQTSIIPPVQLEETSRLQAQIQDLVNRAKNISERYKQGDLSDEEREFVNCLIKMSQSIHEQEMVSKANELRRRDTSIKNLQARIATLESTLARLLQEKARTESGAEGRSMIDLKAWMTSSPLSAEGPEPKPDDNVVAIAPPQELASTGTMTQPKEKVISAALVHEDMSDGNSGDDTPLSELTKGLGKRERIGNSPLRNDRDQNEELTRPSRRVKTATQPEKTDSRTSLATTRIKGSKGNGKKRKA